MLSAVFVSWTFPSHTVAGMTVAGMFRPKKQDEVAKLKTENKSVLAF